MNESATAQNELHESGSATSAAEMRRRSRRRLFSRMGYGAMVALLIFSTCEAYWIQSALSQRSLENYRRYVAQDEIVFQARQCVWYGSIYARDFFLKPDPNRAAIFKEQVAQLRSDSLARVNSLAVPQPRRDEVRATLLEFWDALDRAADLMVGVTGKPARDFVEAEITPKRSAASKALRELTYIDQQAVENSELAFTRQRQSAARQILLVLGLTLILGVTVAVFSVRRTEHLEKELRQNFERVAEAGRELEQLSQRLIVIQEEERGRLARALHDEIGQILTAIRIEISRSLSVSGAVPEEARERLGRARELVGRAVQTVRNISLLLRPAALDDLGLIPALSWQIEDFSRRSGIECDFVEENVQDILPADVKTCAYRAVQEALHNCEKHSGATHVRIRLAQTPTALRMEIADNGHGVEFGASGMPRKRSGSGLLGMRERIVILGGDLTLDCPSGGGLRLSIRIPVSPQTPSPEAVPCAGEGGR